MTPTPILTEAEQKNLAYLRTNHRRPEFAVARRQQWHKLLGYLDKLTEKIRTLTFESTQRQYHATGLYLAATGQLTAAMIDASPVLSEAQKAQCHELRAIFLGQGPRQLAPAQPDVVQYDSTNQA